jgi:hypothetical protein
MQSLQTKEQRFTLNRFYYMMGKGWFVEAREGLQGPFLKRADAETHLEVVKKEFGWKRG